MRFRDIIPYAAFGKVIEGMEYVNNIAETKTDYSDRPMAPQTMKTVTVETFGIEKVWEMPLKREDAR